MHALIGTETHKSQQSSVCRTYNLESAATGIDEVNLETIFCGRIR